MIKLLLSLLLMQIGNAFAQDAQIKISQQQIDNLDIKVAGLTASQQIPLFNAPAKVVVPADKEVLISSSQPGLVSQLPANIGDHVNKGQVLAIVNSPELLALQQMYLSASNDLNLSGLERRRDQQLWEEGAIAERRWQETQMMYSSRSAKADESKQLLLLAGMTSAEIKTLAQSRKLSNQLTLRSPVSGVVLDRLATLGTRLDVQSPLYRIADLSELWLEINVPQERAANLRVGDKVKLEDSNVTAKISLLGQSVNRDNQTVLARAVIDGQASGLRVGQNLNVQVLQNGQQAGFKVPNTAIAQNEGRAYLFVRNQDGFVVTEVKVIGKLDAESLISGGLSGNEQIAIKGAVALKANWQGLGGGE